MDTIAGDHSQSGSQRAEYRQPDAGHTSDLVLLTAEDVSDLLQVDTSFVYKLSKAGRLKSVRLGPRCVRFHPDDLRAYIEARRIAT